MKMEYREGVFYLEEGRNHIYLTPENLKELQDFAEKSLFLMEDVQAYIHKMYDDGLIPKDAYYGPELYDDMLAEYITARENAERQAAVEGRIGVNYDKCLETAFYNLCMDDYGKSEEDIDL